MGKLNRRNFCWCHCGFLAKPGNRYINGHGFRGKHHTEEAKQNMRGPHGPMTEEHKQKLRKPRSEEQKQNMRGPMSEENKQKRRKPRGPMSEERKIKMRKPHGPFTEEHKQNMKIAQNQPEAKESKSKSAKKYWQNSEWKANQFLAIGKGLCILPNRPETHLSLTLSERYLGEMKYTGDFSFTIGGKCPDFVSCNGQKKCIELFGDYWHQGQDPQDRINIFAKYGYDTLIIWEHELKDMDKLYVKLDEFMRK